LLYPFFPYASLGYLICEIICDKDINPQTIASMAKIELEKIASDQVDISEFNAAKEIIKKNRRILATGNHFWLTSLADKVLTGRNISTNFKERLNLVRPEDVVKLASNIMNNGNYRVLAWTE
jgi:hypothetical protein